MQNQILERWKLASAPPYSEFVYMALIPMMRLPYINIYKTRPRTAGNNESSCARAEDGPQYVSHKIFTSGRCPERAMRELDLATSYKHAVATYRNIFITLLATIDMPATSTSKL